MAEVQIIELPPKALCDRIGSARSPGLQRNVLTPDAKRWQLWGKGVRGTEADAIITELYGPQDG